jgi:hypothetical protein
MSILETFKIEILWWIGGPSVLGLYGLFYLFFNEHLWKISLFKRIGLVKVPNLNGTWKGKVISSFDDHKNKTSATIEIKQKWNQIEIFQDTKTSRSKSVIGSIITYELTGAILSYEYINEPKANAKDSMHVHRGTARLIYIKDKKQLEGEYYTGRDRQNFGVLKFRLKN